jgi:hypothetical protein
MTTKQRSTIKLGIYIRTETDSGYFHVRGSIVSIGPTQGDLRAIKAGTLDAWKIPDKVRNISDLPGLYLDSLEINSQGNNDDRERHLYGWDLRYRDKGFIDRHEAKRMWQTLTILEKKLDRLTEQLGSPVTFGAYLARIATVIGAKSFVMKSEHDHGRTTFYDDTQWNIRSIREGVYAVDRLIEIWVNANKPEQEKTA